MAAPIVFTNSAYLNYYTPFTPASALIQAISNANPAVVTTQSATNYQTGLQVRLVLPGDFGMNFLNGQQFFITVLSPTTFSIPIDTSNSSSFALGSNLTPPQVIPIGEVDNSLLQAVQNSGILEVQTPI